MVMTPATEGRAVEGSGSEMAKTASGGAKSFVWSGIKGVGRRQVFHFFGQFSTN
jgi:hypothetical protein